MFSTYKLTPKIQATGSILILYLLLFDEERQLTLVFFGNMAV